MFRSLPKRALLSWLLGRLGPPPPPPRRHFSKSWDHPPRHHRGARDAGHRGGGAGAAGRARQPE